MVVPHGGGVGHTKPTNPNAPLYIYIYIYIYILRGQRQGRQLVNPPRLCDPSGAQLTACRFRATLLYGSVYTSVFTPPFQKANVTLVTFARACRNAVLLDCGFPHTKTTPGEPKCNFTSPPEGLLPLPPSNFWGCLGGHFRR